MCERPVCRLRDDAVATARLTDVYMRTVLDLRGSPFAFRNQSSVPITDLLSATEVAVGLDCRRESEPVPVRPPWPHATHTTEASTPLTFADVGVGIMIRPSASFLRAAGLASAANSSTASPPEVIL